MYRDNRDAGAEIKALKVKSSEKIKNIDESTACKRIMVEIVKRYTCEQ